MRVLCQSVPTEFRIMRKGSGRESRRPSGTIFDVSAYVLETKRLDAEALREFV